jgi:hypothetical protein
VLNNTTIKQINISEKQFNIIYLIISILLLVPAFLLIVDYETSIIGNINMLQGIHSIILWYVLVPAFVLIKLGQGFNVIPTYPPNPLSVIWPNFDEVNYPNAYKYMKRFDSVIVIMVYIYGYLKITHQI